MVLAIEVEALKDQWTSPLDMIEQEMSEESVLNLFDQEVTREFTKGQAYEGWIDEEGRWLLKDNQQEVHVVNGIGKSGLFVGRFKWLEGSVKSL